MIIWLTAIGAFLRLYRLEASLQFLGDQGRDALILRNLLVNHDLPFIGPVTSVGGFFLGPLYYYLMAPFLWLFKFNPVGPAVATAVLGIATIPLLCWVTKKLFSRRVGLWAAGLYALAYIPISETRSAWNPNPMPLAALGIIYGFYLTNYKNQPKGLLLAAASLGVALQLHYMIVFLAPFILWQLFLARRHIRELVPAALIFLLLNLPLFLFEIKNNWLNVRGLLEFLGKHQYGSLDWWQVIKNTVGRSEQAIGMVLGFGRDFNVLRT
ncbi:glycosyltransferase family 39 protein, partial [Microgenomates group bacterium]|nr:glycosyltransferase family 39 protein [Microgenomates group bacterium]